MTPNEKAELVKETAAKVANSLGIRYLPPGHSIEQLLHSLIAKVEEPLRQMLDRQGLGLMDAAHRLQVAEQKLHAATERERVLREALRFYAEGAPVCEGKDGPQTGPCPSDACEFPKCCENQFPIWDRGETARQALNLPDETLRKESDEK